MASTVEEQRLDLERERLDWEKAQAEQKSRESKAASGPGGILSSILGMGSAVGGMIPSLRRKGPQQEYLERQQRGGGAGAATARQAASEAARRVVGTVGGRGGQGMIREGLRAAEDIAHRGAQQAGLVAAAESQAATQMLRQNEIMRRQAWQKLGAGVGQGLAGLGAVLASARDQGPVQPEAAGAAGAAGAPGEVPGMITQTPREAMIAEAAAGHADTQATMEGFVRTIEGAKQQAGQAYQAEANRILAGGGTPGTVASAMAQPGARPTPQQQPAAGGYVRDTGFATATGQSVQGLMNATAEKQQAEEVYERSVETGDDRTSGMSMTKPTQVPPPMTMPESVEAWIYQQAINYDPRLNQGLAPEEAAKLLAKYGFPIDWNALGIVDISGAFEPADGTNQ